MPPKAKSIKITLYAPSIDVTIKNFPITSSQSHATILNYIRAAVHDVSQAWPYDLKHQPIEDFQALEDGQTLLIATCYFERPLSETDNKMQIVREGAAERAWMAIDVQQKKEYIASLPKEKMWITLSANEMQSRADHGTLPNLNTSNETCIETMQENWGLPLKAILGYQGMVMPYGELDTWHQNILLILTVLSEASIGQGKLVSDMIVDELVSKGKAIVEAKYLKRVLGRLITGKTTLDSSELV
jgi:hypothetical protein